MITWLHFILILSVNKKRSSCLGCHMCQRGAPHLPWTSLSFRNHRMLAAGLLPNVVHVRVTSSPSRAGLVKPVISGRAGTPEVSGNFIWIIRKDISWITYQNEHMPYKSCVPAAVCVVDRKLEHPPNQGHTSCKSPDDQKFRFKDGGAQ